MDFIEQYEAENLADTGDCVQQVESRGIVVLGGCEDRECEVPEQLVVIGDEGEGDRDGLLDGRSVKALSDPCAGGLIGELLANRRQVLLAGGIVHVG